MIEEHHDESDIQMLYFKEDYNRWKSESQIIEKEISFFNKIISLENMSLLNNQTNSTDTVKKSLEEFKILHDKVTVELNQIRNNSEGIRECNDLQCENYYINDFALFKTKIEQHFECFRKLKATIINLYSIS